MANRVRIDNFYILSNDTVTIAIESASEHDTLEMLEVFMFRGFRELGVPFRTKFSISIVGEQNDENAEECTICMERNCNLLSVKCNHSFCRECIQSWVDTHHDTCPLCRKQLETFKHIKVKKPEQV
jgi:hypothetical protein